MSPKPTSAALYASNAKGKERVDNRYSTIALFLIAFAGSLLGCGILLAATPDSVLPVFVGYRLFMTHLFASIPLACLLASKVRDKLPQYRFAFILLAICTLALPLSLESISWTFRQIETGFFLRWFVRCFVAFSLSLGWIVTSPIKCTWRPTRAWSWTLLLWLAIPGVYAWRQSELDREEFDANLSGMRLSRAYDSEERLVETIGPIEIKGVRSDEWRRKLKKEIAYAEKSVALPIPKDASLEANLQRAMQLLTLSRYSEAERVLVDSRSSDYQVTLLRAVAARELHDWEQVELRCRELLSDQLTNKREGDPLVFQLLGESQVGQRKIKEAIKSYEFAVQQCQKSRGEFEIRLGTLLGEAGNYLQAIEHFQLAMTVEPSLAPEANKRIRGLQSNSCQP